MSATSADLYERHIMHFADYYVVLTDIRAGFNYTRTEYKDFAAAYEAYNSQAKTLFYAVNSEGRDACISDYIIQEHADKLGIPRQERPPRPRRVQR